MFTLAFPAADSNDDEDARPDTVNGVPPKEVTPDRVPVKDGPEVMGVTNNPDEVIVVAPDKLDVIEEDGGIKEDEEEDDEEEGGTTVDTIVVVGIPSVLDPDDRCEEEFKLVLLPVKDVTIVDPIIVVVVPLLGGAAGMLDIMLDKVVVVPLVVVLE